MGPNGWKISVFITIYTQMLHYREPLAAGILECFDLHISLYKHIASYN